MKLSITAMIVLSFTVIYGATYGQHTLTIETCYNQAKENYPLIKKLALIEKSKGYSIENATSSHFPQLSLGAQASYQSAVTTIPFQLPGKSIEAISKDQYKIYGDIEQSIYDGGRLKENKKIINANAALENQSLEVALYALKESINQIYFGVLRIDAATTINALHLKDIASALAKTEAMIAAGTALKSNAAVLKADWLQVAQEKTTLASNRQAFMEQLALFLNEPLDSQTVLTMPEMPQRLSGNQRPELSMYDAQLKVLQSKVDLTYKQNQPQIGLFLQGGYGRPGLNMLSNQFDPYYIGGVRLSLPLTGLYTARRQRQLLENDQSSTKIQKETFKLNTKVATASETEAIDRYSSLLQSDDQILDLRTQVKETAWAQFQNGILTIHEYLKELDEQSEALQNKNLHAVELLYWLYHRKTTLGQ